MRSKENTHGIRGADRHRRGFRYLHINDLVWHWRVSGRYLIIINPAGRRVNKRINELYGVHPDEVDKHPQSYPIQPGALRQHIIENIGDFI